MATLEQRVKQRCDELGCTFTEYKDSHFLIDSGDRRVFASNSHSITAHIYSWSTNVAKMRNDALRYMLEELEDGLWDSGEQCDDEDDCEVCNA